MKRGIFGSKHRSANDNFVMSKGRDMGNLPRHKKKMAKKMRHGKSK